MQKIRALVIRMAIVAAPVALLVIEAAPFRYR